MTQGENRTKTGKAVPVLRHGVRLLWLVLCLPVVFVLVAAVLMLDQEVTAPSWIKARVSDRAGAMLGGGDLQFGQINVLVGRDLHPRIRVVDAVLRDAEGTVISRVKEIGGLLSPRGLVFDGAALVQEVTLSGADVALRRDYDGRIAVAFGAGETRSFDGLPGLLDQVDRVFQRPALAALEQVAVDGLVIRFDDNRAGRSWTADGGRLTLDVRGGGTDLDLDMSLLSAGGVAQLALTYDSPADSRVADITLDFEDFPARDLATQSPALTWLGALDAPLSGRIETALDDGSNVGLLKVGLSMGRGQLRPNAGGAPVQIDGMEAALTYDPQALLLQFESLALRSEWGAFDGQGQAFASVMTGGLPTELVGQFTFKDVALNPVGVYAKPVTLADLSADLRVRLDPFAIDLGQVVIHAGDTVLQAKGHVAAGAEGWTAALDLEAEGLDRTQIMDLWPADVRVGMRKWFAANLLGGRLRDLAAGWRIAPQQEPQLAMTFDFDDAQVRFLGTMPPIMDAAGSASMQGERFTLVMRDGHVTAPEGGRVDLAGSVMTLPALKTRGGPIELDLTLGSSVTAALSMLDQAPFRYLQKANLPVDVAAGQAEISAQVTFPLRNPVPAADVVYEARARLRDVASDRLIKGRRLTGDNVIVTGNRAGLTIEGPVALDGVAATGRWEQRRGTAGTRVVADVALSAAGLAAFGVALPRGMVTGRGTGRLTLDMAKDVPPAFSLTSDLRGIGLAVPAIGWQKGAGSRGSIEMSGRLGAVPRIDRLEVVGGGLQANGSVTLAPEGGLREARFERVRLSGWLDAPVTLRGRGAGQPVGVTIGGGTLDLRQANLGGGGGGSGGDSGPMEVTLRRLQIAEGIALTNFKGSFGGGAGLAGNFSATVNDGPGLRGSVVPQGGRTALRVISDDAGGIVRAAGLLQNGIGGALDLTLLPTGGAGTFDGFLSVKGIRVRDAPAMAALLDAISVVGLLQQLDGQGLAFDDVDARFRLTPDQVTITQASAVGPGLGISIDGAYGLSNKTLDFQGVVSPFYLLNGIGSVLTRKGEGLIGFNFSLRGPVSAPQVGVNPLSVLTPGMFRDIFRKPPPQVTE